MSESEREEEQIETREWYRVKKRGTTVVAVELQCPRCHEHYWLPTTEPSWHSCRPDRLGGATVINKYG